VSIRGYSSISSGVVTGLSIGSTWKGVGLSPQATKVEGANSMRPLGVANPSWPLPRRALLVFAVGGVEGVVLVATGPVRPAKSLLNSSR
jgi:hypothetical protein